MENTNRPTLKQWYDNINLKKLSDEDKIWKHAAWDLLAAQDSWERDLANHLEKIKKDALYALSWSGGFIETAAFKKVSDEVLAMWDSGYSAAEVKAFAADRMIMDASTSRSTSVLSNLTQDATRHAWSNVYRMFRKA